jgi:prolyl 4-hydroxylase
MSPEIALAEEHDAAGRHDEAINALARATQAGDVEATTRLGKRLLVGDRAPCLPAEGARFLFDANEQGGAEAAARLAVLHGAGVQVAQNWRAAFELLIVAAERGWAPAREQVAVLASEAAVAEQRARSGGTAWRTLGAAVDLASWFGAPAGETLHSEPLVRTFREFLSPRVCAWLIAQSRDRLARAQVYDPVSKQDITHATRTNTAAGFGLIEAGLVHLLVQQRMASACGLPLDHMEALAVLHYEVGEQIDDHFDFVDPRTPDYAEHVAAHGQRVITFLIYLNDDYAGGETDFPHFSVCHKGARGEGLFFVNALPSGEPDLRSVHAGRPPRTGEKWIVSQFIRNRRFLGS